MGMKPKGDRFQDFTIRYIVKVEYLKILKESHPEIKVIVEDNLEIT